MANNQLQIDPTQKPAFPSALKSYRKLYKLTKKIEPFNEKLTNGIMQNCVKNPIIGAIGFLKVSIKILMSNLSFFF